MAARNYRQWMEAVGSGDLDELRQLEPSVARGAASCRAAASKGQLGTLQWLRSQDRNVLRVERHPRAQRSKEHSGPGPLC